MALSPKNEFEESIDAALKFKEKSDVMRCESETIVQSSDPPRLEPKTYGRFKTIDFDTKNSDFVNLAFERQSCRSLRGPMTKKELGELLTVLSPNPHGKRSYPSAGMLYPVQIYFYCHDVIGLERGLYYYDIPNLQLIYCFPAEVCSDDEIEALSEQADGACLTFILTIDVPRICHKYAGRGLRYGLVEVGSVATLLNIKMIEQGLTGCWIGGFSDEDISKLVGLDWAIDNEAPMLLLAVGRVAETIAT